MGNEPSLHLPHAIQVNLERAAAELKETVGLGRHDCWGHGNRLEARAPS
jgi:hypothetical protein